eukprot:6358415-Pyramimonas_sp.AAC.1
MEPSPPQAALARLGTCVAAQHIVGPALGAGHYLLGALAFARAGVAERVPQDAEGDGSGREGGRAAPRRAAALQAWPLGGSADADGRSSQKRLHGRSGLHLATLASRREPFAILGRAIE